MTDFIEEYSDFLLSNVPTSKEWAEDLATGILSSVMGPNRYVSTRLGNLRMNVWHVFIGPSGLSYKTLPLKDYVTETLIKTGELLGKDLLLPSSFSMEGMVEYLKEHSNQGLIVRDEVSTMFKEIAGGKPYLSDGIEFSSQLYDGTIQKRFTRKAKLEEVQHCYVSFLGSTTPYIYDIVERFIFIQGLGNRLLYDLWEGKGGIKTYNGDELFYDSGQDQARKKKIEDFAQGLAKLNKMAGFFVSPEPERASHKLANFKKTMDLEAKRLYDEDPFDLRSSYFSRAGEMGIKLAGLKAISRSWKTLPSSKIEEIIIIPKDVGWAEDKVNRHLRCFDAFLGKWEVKPMTPKPISHRFSKEAFVACVKNSKDGIIRQMELIHRLGWYLSQSYYDLVKTVVLEGDVKPLSEEEIERLPKDVKIRHKLDRFKGKPPAVFKYTGSKGGKI